MTTGLSCINESVPRETIKPGNANIQAFPGNLSIQHVTRDIHRDQTAENKEQ
jgi:hypothetical protein